MDDVNDFDLVDRVFFDFFTTLLVLGSICL
jgi:hypothetical protein